MSNATRFLPAIIMLPLACAAGGQEPAQSRAAPGPSRVLDPILGNGLVVDPGDAQAVTSIAHAFGARRCAER
jgi:hypothetical protein